MAERTTRQRRRRTEPAAQIPAPAAEPAAPRRRAAAERTVPAPPAEAALETASGASAAASASAAEREATRSQEVFAPPPVDIYEDDQGLVVVADLPGVEPGALDVRVEQGVLTLLGRTQALATGTPVHREYELTGFFRQFQLPEEIDTGRIEAQLTQGVLTLRLPRAAPAAPRRIAVRGA
jgi:HSP20 family molecular chaperone IbpA